MTEVPMLDNIRGQVASLEGVLRHSLGEGRSSLEEAATMLRKCRGRIMVTGMGASFFAAMPAVQMLEGHGSRVVYQESSELLHVDESSWGRGDVAILISRSGGSIETVDLAADLERRGLQTIAVTNLPGSRLEAHSTITLSVHSAPDQLIAVQTYTGTLLVLMLLVEQVIRPGESALAPQCSSSLPALSTHIDVSLDRSEAWKELLVGQGPLYLLGRGRALAALAEGALLFHETAKVAVLPMSSGQFRHGPVEVVSPEFRALILGTPETTAILDWQLAKDLRAMKARVGWLGLPPSGSGLDDLSLMSWPEGIASELMPLFDIVPMQVAAYRTALWRGVRPGDFRYASEITDKESGFPLFEASLA